MEIGCLEQEEKKTDTKYTKNIQKKKWIRRTIT